MPTRRFYVVLLGRAPNCASFFCAMDLFVPAITLPLVISLAIAGFDVFPSAATKGRVPESAIAQHDIQNNVAVRANGFFEIQNAGSAAGKAVAVSNVAEVRKLAGTAAVGAGAGGGKGGGHRWRAVEASTSV